MAKIYSKEQRQALEAHFRMDRYPSAEAQKALAARLNLKDSHVKVWFLRRRAASLPPKPASRVQRLQGLRPLQGPAVCTHFLLCSGPHACPAPAPHERPGPGLEGEGTPGPPAPAPDAQDTFRMLSVSTGTPEFLEGATPEDQEKAGSARLGSTS
ncbi:homeobox protein DBX1-like [Heterocephalus glaber]|uniref:Homeobox protein DBX1-like n=1 Tax=Heterocephalus glaber TaxID=10181 RepID=A0AAX6RZ33_HETGA|nr:homeobox protein DBX1-like [Heterocephalus glaber]